MNNKQEIIKEIKEFAHNNNVPIVFDDGLELIIETIKKENCKNILEIGTAIGYSSSNMALVNDDIFVDTIERMEPMYKEALKNIKRLDLEDKVNIYFGDALDFDDSLLKDNYDLIFIDAAKAQYINFFEKYEKHLKVGGIIISDNLAFHGLVETNGAGESRRIVALVRKIKRYVNWLNENKNYETTYYSIGDGVAISRKLK